MLRPQDLIGRRIRLDEAVQALIDMPAAADLGITMITGF